MRRLSLIISLLIFTANAFAQSCEELLLSGWRFCKGAVEGAQAADFDDSRWQLVTIPHDWAISGPFDKDIDKQVVAIEQNGEQTADTHTARSGGLPWIGKGCYRTSVNIPEVTGRSLILSFDGAMSRAKVIVNGKQAGEWPYGYNAFNVDISPFVIKGRNEIAVLLENVEESSRWYPGAGLFREVRLIDKPSVHIPVWGQYITTPVVNDEEATVTVKTEIEGLANGSIVTLETVIRDAEGREAGRRKRGK